MVFTKLRGVILQSVIGVVATTLAIQAGWVGTNTGFVQNLMAVIAIDVVSYILSRMISNY